MHDAELELKVVDDTENTGPWFGRPRYRTCPSQGQHWLSWRGTVRERKSSARIAIENAPTEGSFASHGLQKHK